MNLTVMWHFLFGAHELIQIFVCGERKLVAVVMEVLGAMVQNLAALATRHLRFVHP